MEFLGYGCGACCVSSAVWCAWMGKCHSAKAYNRYFMGSHNFFYTEIQCDLMELVQRLKVWKKAFIYNKVLNPD